jgi:alkanesulfonate monooxygenase SsuD/methylene tetrahydromethanopterin reductase-like flavin-dependent oxidoreductase (luciferase family)
MPLLECWTALSALARYTGRLRLGTSVLCNSYRLPSVLAKMGATLDVISGGRLDLGLGAGWFEKEYRAYGIPFPPIGERIAQLDEGVEVIRRMWTEAALVHGRYHDRGRHLRSRAAQRRIRRSGSAASATGHWRRCAADGVNAWWWRRSARRAGASRRPRREFGGTRPLQRR